MCWECELRDDSDEPSALPPVVLPSAAELLKAAERSAVLGDLRQYVAGLDGESPPGTTVIARWAEACGLVRVLKGAHVPVKKNGKLLKHPLELWARAFESVGQVSYDLTVEGIDVSMAFGLLLPELVAGLRMMLYTAGGPIPRELLYAIADDLAELPMPAEEPDSPWRQGLVVTVDLLERLGAVENIVADPAELAKIAELTGTPVRDPTLITFTPIALWAMNRMLRAGGMEAPVVGELAGEKLGPLCAHLARCAPEVAQAELSAWVARRSPDAAADEAAELLRRTDSPAERFFALLVLGEAGEPGLAAAAEVRAEGGIRGAVSAAWLVNHGALEPETLATDEVALGMTDHLAAMHEMGLLLVEMSELHEPAGLVGVIAAADHPDRLTLLDVIAQDHPDRKIAKQARKARYKLRS